METQIGRHTKQTVWETADPRRRLAAPPQTSVVFANVVFLQWAHLQKSHTPLSCHFAWRLKTTTGDNEFQPDLGRMEGGPPHLKGEDGRQKRHGRESLRNVPREKDRKSIPSKLPMPCGPWSLRGTQGTRAEHKDSCTKPTKEGMGCFPPGADGKARRDKWTVKTSKSMNEKSNPISHTCRKRELAGVLREIALCRAGWWPWLSPALVFG